MVDDTLKAIEAVREGFKQMMKTQLRGTVKNSFEKNLS